MKIKEPEIYIKPQISGVNILDFHKAEYILKCSEKAAEKMKIQILSESL